MKALSAGLAAFCLLGADKAWPRDYWLEAAAQTDSAAAGIVVLHLEAGASLEHAKAETIERRRLERFEDIHGDDRADLMPQVDDAPATLDVPMAAAGVHIIAMDRAAALTEITAGDFNRYLQDKGLDAVLQQRQATGEDVQPARERYRRYVKTYVQVGPDDDWDRSSEAHQTLEIIPTVNPLDLKAGQHLPLEVRFEGEPLPHAQLTASARMPGGKLALQRVTTDAQGRAVIELHSSGLWLLQSVHMRRAALDDDLVDWDSYWATCTFLLP